MQESVVQHRVRFDLRLLMVAAVRICNKQIIREPHKRSQAIPATDRPGVVEIVDLSHAIDSGMITYKGLPAPPKVEGMGTFPGRAYAAVSRA